MILQAYDFTELRRRYDCILQIGGSDQWGNIINGIDLTRKVLKEEIFGLTSPLLTTSDGKKMGKSQNGAIWLNKDLMSPYEFWQFWRNISDQDVKKFFLLLYTEIPIEECIALASLEGAKINEAKVVLANSVTSLCHGTDAAEKAQQTSSKVFKNNDLDENLPAYELNLQELQPDISLIKLFVISGLSKSGKEVKRLITEKGLSYNNKILESNERRLNRQDLQKPIKLSVGKKKHIMVKLKDYS
jgi:tyrosyl-tRNA synthetase